MSKHSPLQGHSAEQKVRGVELIMISNTLDIILCYPIWFHACPVSSVVTPETFQGWPADISVKSKVVRDVTWTIWCKQKDNTNQGRLRFRPPFPPRIWHQICIHRNVYCVISNAEAPVPVADSFSGNASITSSKARRGYVNYIPNTKGASWVCDLSWGGVIIHNDPFRQSMAITKVTSEQVWQLCHQVKSSTGLLAVMTAGQSL